ncbi:MAG TPA: glucose-6-phosphate isomerase, partial [Verrucomicrobiales bacterium]|nr:glucose-6-phosphate isomerase [Verrucomicrobiales bacterium]
METDALKLWDRYRERTTFHDEIGLTLDLSRVNLPDQFWAHHQEPMESAFNAMAELESG